MTTTEITGVTLSLFIDPANPQRAVVELACEMTPEQRDSIMVDVASELTSIDIGSKLDWNWSPSLPVTKIELTLEGDCNIETWRLVGAVLGKYLNADVQIVTIELMAHMLKHFSRQATAILFELTAPMISQLLAKS